MCTNCTCFAHILRNVVCICIPPAHILRMCPIFCLQHTFCTYEECGSQVRKMSAAQEQIAYIMHAASVQDICKGTFIEQLSRTFKNQNRTNFQFLSSLTAEKMRLLRRIMDR